jgi:type III pantothenate kinase
MNLLIDVGNTRVKWTLADGLTLQPQQAALHADFSAKSLRPLLLAHAQKIRRTLVANVGGPEFQTVISDAVREHTGQVPEFLRSSAELCGVRNAYRVPEKLGSDRWAAMIGARQLHSNALCIVSVGTAMTIDVLDRKGTHRGGLILPGPELMIGSLLKNTSEIAPRAATGERNDALLAVDTLGAIAQGAEQALSALVDRVMSQMQALLGEPLVLILTGGACARVEPLISTRGVVISDLVLQGLAVIAQSEAGT